MGKHGNSQRKDKRNAEYEATTHTYDGGHIVFKVISSVGFQVEYLLGTDGRFTLTVNHDVISSDRQCVSRHNSSNSNYNKYSFHTVNIMYWVFSTFYQDKNTPISTCRMNG